MFEKFINVPFSLLSYKQISDTISNKCDKYFDLDFAPMDSSVFQNHIDSPIDVVIHWRRPEEFLKPNYQLGTLKPVVF